jgi:hypothetical protein
VPVEGLEEFRRAAAALAGADRVVMSEVGKSMRAVARPIVNQIRAEVKSSKGESPKGVHASEVERQLHVLGRVRGSGEGGRFTERQARSVAKKLEKARSLRESIAGASGSAVSAGARKVELAFKVRASQLPASQRKLPRRWDQENGWRHPVFGNRNVWVTQRGHPYFRKTIFRSRDEVTSGVVTAMSTAAERIMHPDEGGVV